MRARRDAYRRNGRSGGSTRQRLPPIVVCLLAVALGASGLEAPAAAAAAPAPEDPRSAASRAASLLDELRRSTGTPALSVAVASGGRLVFTWGGGLADVEHQTPATPDTVYNVGSVSKAITAVAVAQLLESGSVALGDPIRKYAPTLPATYDAITVRHLLTHTSGIRHYRAHDFPGPDWEENHRPFASITDAAAIFSHDPLLFAPGKYYFYSSYGVNLLQAVVEQATGRAFEDYLRERVWLPAGMTRTALDVAGRDVPGRARGYDTRHGAPTPTGPVDVSYKYAGGGMLSTAPDLALLAVAINHRVVLGDAGAKALFTPELPVVRRFQEKGPVVTERFRQALLWRLVVRPDGHDFAYECGTFNGFNACVLDYTGEDLVVALTTNSEAIGYKPAEALAALFRAPAKR